MKGLSFVGVIVILLSLFMWSCSADSREALMPEDEVCDTENVTYSLGVQPIILTNCFSCHNDQNKGGGITLEGYANVNAYVGNGLLSCTINFNAGCSPMPQGASKMAACDIAKIDQWISDGAPNN